MLDKISLSLQNFCVLLSNLFLGHRRPQGKRVRKTEFWLENPGLPVAISGSGLGPPS